MNFGLCSSLMVLVALLGACGCSARSSVKPLASGVARPADCQLEIVRDGASPTSEVRVLGSFDVHIERHVLGGSIDREASLLSEIRDDACALGAGAIVIQGEISSDIRELQHYHAWGDLVIVHPRPSDLSDHRENAEGRTQR